MIYAVIPARKGSERLPGKNLKEFKGKSLVEIAIDQALRIFPKDRIIVNSDDKRILKIAEKKQVAAYNRPEGLALSETSMTDVLKDLVNNFGLEISVIVLLQPTSPLRSDDDIKSAIAQFWIGGKKSLATVSPNKKYNGAVFIYRSDSISPNYEHFYVMDKERSIDIDTQLDWEIASLL